MEEITDSTASQASDLHRVAKANEDIKKVIRVSSGVNLVALNAMLIAKRSGERSRGFAVMSAELRVFSRKLAGAMAGLGTLIFDLTRDAAAMRKQHHERRHLLNIQAQKHTKPELIDPVLARMDEHMYETGEKIERDWFKLRLELGRVLQLCETGGNLARSAKIEAVYGGDMSVTLKQVASQIEETVSEIFSILKLLRTQLAE